MRRRSSLNSRAPDSSKSGSAPQFLRNTPMCSAISPILWLNCGKLSSLPSADRTSHYSARAGQPFLRMRLRGKCRARHHREHCARTFRSRTISNGARHHARRIFEFATDPTVNSKARQKVTRCYRYPSKPSDEGRAASGSAAFDLFVELLYGDA